MCAVVDMQPSSLFKNEELLVAELEQLGVGYLSRQTTEKVTRPRSPHKILADLIQQPSGRVRAALISVLLAHPLWAEYIPAALKSLPPDKAQTMKLFYTAAMLLQRQYAESLQAFIVADWRWLPDLFSAELNLPPGSPGEQIAALGRFHQQITGIYLNWAGTYENAAHCLLRRWELEKTWNQ